MRQKLPGSLDPVLYTCIAQEAHLLLMASCSLECFHDSFLFFKVMVMYVRFTSCVMTSCS